MRISEAMTRDVKIISPEDSIEKAADLMRECDCGALPVGKNDRLIGVVTDRDIVVRAVALGKQPKNCTVRDVMTPGVKYVFEDESPESAADSMSRLQIRRLPVLNHHKRLVGIVTLGDLAARHQGSAATVALRRISQPSV